MLNVVLGDFNVSTSAENPHRQMNEYENLLSELSFQHCIKEHTRVSNNSFSCLDHIMINFNKEIQPIVFCNSITDHFITLLGIKIKLSTSLNNERNNKKNKFYKVINEAQLSELLAEQTWEMVFAKTNVEEGFKEFAEIIQNAIKNSKEIKYIYPIKKRKLKPWMISGLVVSIRKRDKLHLLCKSNPINRGLLSYYKKYRNLLSSLIRKAKVSYFTNKINHSCDSKKSWNVIREILDKQQKRKTK